MGADPSKLEQLVQKYQELQPTFAGAGRKLTGHDLLSHPSSNSLPKQALLLMEKTDANIRQLASPRNTACIMLNPTSL